jgi:hypothetical protein
MVEPEIIGPLENAQKTTKAIRNVATVRGKNSGKFKTATKRSRCAFREREKYKANQM